MLIVAIDPSGNFVEGKGKTGIILFDMDNETGEWTIKKVSTISAERFEDRFDYWESIINWTYGVHHVVIEDYRLYNHKGARASMQSGSLLETPRLLGMLTHDLDKRCVPYNMQMARSVGGAYSNDILIELGLLEKRGNRYYHGEHSLNEHEIMAFKHFLKWFDDNVRK